jgi:hypothetical protein
MVNNLDLLEGLVARSADHPDVFRQVCVELARAETIRIGVPTEASGDQLTAVGILCSAFRTTAVSTSVAGAGCELVTVLSLLELDDSVSIEDAPAGWEDVSENILLTYGRSDSEGSVMLGPRRAGGSFGVCAASCLWAAAAVGAGVLLTAAAAAPTRLAFALDDRFVSKVYGLVGEERSAAVEDSDHAVLETARIALGLNALPTLGLLS